MIKPIIDQEEAKSQAINQLKNRKSVPTKNKFLHFGYTLKKIRVISQLSVWELGELAGTKGSRISEYENGVRMPTITTLELIISGLKRCGVSEDMGDVLREAYDETIEHRTKATIGQAYRVNK